MAGNPRRNSIKRYGESPAQFGKMPQELMREPKLSGNGARVAMWLWSHAEGWQTSEKDIADTIGWGRRRVGEGFANLVSIRWLVVQETRRVGGGRVFQTYHRQDERPFTAAEAAELSAPILLSGSDSPTNGLHQNDAGAEVIHVSNQHRIPVSKQHTKEDQEEDQEEVLKAQPRAGAAEQVILASRVKALGATTLASQPRDVRSSVLRQVSALLVEGFDDDALREALQEWAARPGAKPGLLPFLVDDVVKERNQSVTRPMATSDRRVAEVQALKGAPMKELM